MNTVMYAYVYVHIYALCQFKKNLFGGTDISHAIFIQKI